MKKIFLLLIGLIITLISSSQVVFVNLATQEVSPSQVFTTTVEINQIQNLGAFELELIFDADLLQANSVTLGAFLGSTGRTVFPLTNNINNTNGLIEFAVTTLGPNPPGPNGDGVLLVIEWISSSSGSGEVITDLILQNVQVAEPDGSIIPIDLLNGTVHILFPEILHTIAESEITCPGTVTIPIIINNFFEITSFELFIDYNSSELSYLTFQNVNALLPELSISNNGNSLVLEYSGDPASIGNGIMVELLFTAQSNNIQITSALIWDEINSTYSTINGNINAIYTNGQILINPLISTIIKPSGPEEVDVNNTPSSLYITHPSLNAETYDWDISPTQAGSIAGNDTLGAVTWSPIYQGYAYIKVSARNGCNSMTSDSLEVIVDNSVGIRKGLADPDKTYIITTQPNPFQEEIKIHYRVGQNGSISFKIFDIYGKQVRQTSIENKQQGDYEITIKRENLAAGVYFISLINNNRILYSKKIFINP